MVWNTFFPSLSVWQRGGVLSDLGNGHIHIYKRGCPKPAQGLVTVVIIVFEVPERKIMVSSLVLWSRARHAGTRVRGSIPEGEQKAHTHSCIAMSTKCTGNNDLFFLVVIVVIIAIVKSKVTSASD